MEIRGKSTYNWQSIKKFNNFIFFKRRKWLSILWIFAYVLSGIGFVFEIVTDNFDGNSIERLILLVLVALWLVFLWFVYPKIKYSKNKLIHNMENEFVFNEDAFTMYQNSSSSDGNNTFKYSALWKVFETKDFFYIYLTQNQAYIVEKSTLEGGSAYDLRELLIKNVGMSKYKLKCKV